VRLSVLTRRVSLVIRHLDLPGSPSGGTWVPVPPSRAVGWAMVRLRSFQGNGGC
jgi:hypothetical protein